MMRKSTAIYIHQNETKIKMTVQEYESERNNCLKVLDDLLLEYEDDYKRVEKSPRFKLFKSYWKQLSSLNDVPF